MSRRKHFLSNITKTVGASGIQLLITLVTTPIMTRLYAPEAYAMFGIVNTTAVVMVGVGMLSLTNAYTAEKDEGRRGEILHAMLLLLSITFLFSVLFAVVIAATDSWHESIHIPILALIFLPLLVLSYGVRQIMVNIGIQRGIFSRLSLTQVVEPAVSRGGSVVLGALLGGHPILVLITNIAGHATTIAAVTKKLPREVYGQWSEFWNYRRELRATLRRMGDFVVFGTASAQAQHFILLGIQVGIAGFFSGHLAGQYIFATSILNLPISVIALATAPIAYHHFIETEKASPTCLTSHFLGAMGLYLLAAGAVFTPLYFFGEPLFAFAFGEVWTHAGVIASTMSVAYAGMFIVMGVQSIFMVTRRLRLQWYSEILTAIPAIIAGVTCFKIMDFDRAVFYLSWIWLVRSLLLLGAALLASFQRPADTEARSL